MDYDALIELAVELGYRLAISGAETFRVEESVNRLLGAYGIQAEAFSIPNCLIVSIETESSRPITRMRRIGHHGNDLDAVERYSNLSRKLCAEHPDPSVAWKWLEETEQARVHYRLPFIVLGSFLGAAGFAVLFRGDWTDCLCAGVCGVIAGILGAGMDRMKTNPFFKTILSAFVLALAVYGLNKLGLCHDPDAAVIGGLMLLVPGLLFTNAMRDIIYGDINSGVNRIVQVLLVAVAIALGTAVAWNTAVWLWGIPAGRSFQGYGLGLQLLGSFAGCAGFSLLFNIHGHGGLLCVLGGVLGWLVFSLVLPMGDLAATFYATLVCAAYSEIMARVRKYPAISYLVVSLFPMLPGAGVYYTMTHMMQGDVEAFAQEGAHTAAVAGLMAVAILLVSTLVRLWGVWQMEHNKKKAAKH